MFKIAIETLELALAAVNYFRKRAPSYMSDSVLNTPSVRVQFLKRALTLKTYLLKDNTANLFLNFFFKIFFTRFREITYIPHFSEIFYYFKFFKSALYYVRIAF